MVSLARGAEYAPAGAFCVLPYTPLMDRRVALVLLAVLGTGVFLAGLELMITAVALPAIIVDLGSWTDLRHASWIVNVYLLVYVATMPLAGRLSRPVGRPTALPGRPRLLHRRLAAGRHGPVAGPADRRARGAGSGRRGAGPGRHGRGVAPVRGP